MALFVGAVFIVVGSFMAYKMIFAGNYEFKPITYDKPSIGSITSYELIKYSDEGEYWYETELCYKYEYGSGCSYFDLDNYFLDKYGEYGPKIIYTDATNTRIDSVEFETLVGAERPIVYSSENPKRSKLVEGNDGITTGFAPFTVFIFPILGLIAILVYMKGKAKTIRILKRGVFYENSKYDRENYSGYLFEPIHGSITAGKPVHFTKKYTSDTQDILYLPENPSEIILLGHFKNLDITDTEVKEK